MAIYSHGVPSYTPVAHADGASALANSSYEAVTGAAAASLNRINDIYVGGQSAATNSNQMAIRRASTKRATPTNVTSAPNNYLSAAGVATCGVAATTGPTIASTMHLFDISLNTFGGVVRLGLQGEEIYFGTTTDPNAEIVFDSVVGTGLVGQAIKWEEM